MKKIIIALLFPLAFSLFAYSQSKISNDLLKEKLFGRIKNLTKSTYWVEEKSGIFPDTSLMMVETYEYDQKGNLIETAAYNSSSTLYEHTTFTYKYDKMGRKLECLKLKRNIPNDSMMIKVIYKYNDKGYIFEADEFQNNITVDYLKETYKHDNNGNEIEFNNYYISDGKIIRHYMNVINTYDKEGNVKEQFNKNENGDLISKTVFKYDNRGNEVENSSYDAGGILTNKFTRVYDGFDINQNWLKEKMSESNSSRIAIIVREIKYY